MATGVRLDRRYLCLLLTTDMRIGHDVSATASINQARRLPFIAYVMADPLTMLYGFGYDGQKPNSFFDIYSARKCTDRQIVRTVRCERYVYNRISVG